MPDSTPSPIPATPAFVVGVPREIHADECRVAATPSTVKALRKLGIEVDVEAGAGEAASYTDAQYAEAGARIVPNAEQAWGADLVLKVRPPEARPDGGHEVDLMEPGARLVSFIWPAQNQDLVQRLAARRATVLAMDCMPRITRAQRMDALSAMANVAGYRAVIEATHHFGRFMPGQITAAGRVAPAQVLVVGAGVAGLAAVAAARSLGAVVKAFDTRPAVREQVESLGAQFLEFRFDESGEGEGGYAKQVSDAYLAAEQALLTQHAKTSDIIVTTALIPGKPAPQLITSGAVVAMDSGSVIVDLASEQGGNCALTEPGKVVEKFGVTIVGLTDLPSRMARQSSDLYATTVLNLVTDVMKPGAGWKLDLEDDIHRGVLVLLDGELKWPPPSRPQPRAGAPVAPSAATAKKSAPPPPKGMGPAAKALLGGVAVLLLLAGLFGPPSFVQHLTVFLLACVVGWHVVWDVTPALHTPLMSVTNAISGIIVIGGIVVLQSADARPAALVLGAAAVLLAAVNVAGGFLVTQRMLRMFHR
jgi:NAD(P) transhydrogenase subunit alpha